MKNYYNQNVKIVAYVSGVTKANNSAMSICFSADEMKEQVLENNLPSIILSHNLL